MSKATRQKLIWLGVLLLLIAVNFQIETIAKIIISLTH